MKKNQKGFTLLEVLIAISLIGLIAVTMLPIFTLGLKNIGTSGKKTDDLFELTSEIDSTKMEHLEGKPSEIIYEVSGEQIKIPITLYEVKSKDDENTKIEFFKFKKEK